MNTETIHLLDDIYFGLHAGLFLAESRVSTAISNESYRSARGRLDTIQRSLNCLETLRGQLRDGKLHVEPPPGDWKPDSCYCAATSHPPCSFCTSHENEN